MAVLLLFLSSLPLLAQGVAYTVDAGGVSVLTYNGGANLADSTVDIGNGVCASWDGGSCAATGSWSNDSFSNAGPVTVQRTYTDASGSFTVLATMTGAGTNEAVQTLLFTNNSATLTVRPRIDIIGVNFAAATTFTGSTSGASWGNGSPVGRAEWGAQAMYYWYDQLTSPLSLDFNVYATNKYRLTLNTMQNTSVGASTVVDAVAIAPLATLTVTVRYVFSSSSSTALTTAEVSPAYSDMAALYSFTVPTVDRRPIARLILASAGTQTVNNPRAWTFNADKNNAVQFRLDAIAKVNAAITLANAQAVRPSTILIWDIEGQEFRHALSYIGYPSRLSVMAPEMEVVADELVGLIKAAGYQVGFTIRPNTFQYGTSLPASCTYNANPEYGDIYIKTDDAPPYRGWICRNGAACSGTTSGNWCQEGATYPSSQKTPDNLAEIKAILLEKIEYCINRWGAYTFYMDSNGAAWSGIYYEIAAQRPDVLILPEHRASQNYGAQGAYSGDQPNAEWFTPVSVSRVWPNAFITVVPYLQADLEANFDLFTAGMANGSNGLYDVGSGSYWAVTGVTAVAQAAAALNSVIAMTDRGQPRTFKSAPGTSFTYPVTARVYFAATPEGLAASTTYCTRRATDSCYLSGVLQSTAALDLSALPYYQIRYYDFAGNLVSNPGTYGVIQ